MNCLIVAWKNIIIDTKNYLSIWIGYHEYKNIKSKKMGGSTIKILSFFSNELIYFPKMGSNSILKLNNK
jgi:hypothetical protein